MSTTSPSLATKRHLVSCSVPAPPPGSVFLVQSWLNTQCQLLAGVERALVLPTRKSEPPSARWPVGLEHYHDLQALGRQAVDKNRCLVRRGQRSASHRDAGHQNTDIGDAGSPPQPDGFHHLLLGMPLRNGQGPAGVVIVDCRVDSEMQRKALLAQLSQGVQWLKFSLSTRTSEGRPATVDWPRYIATCLQSGHFHDLINGLVNELASQFSCERVCIGMLRGERVRVEALSFSARYNPESERLRLIGDAMEEAIDQDATLFMPASQAQRDNDKHPPTLSLVHARLAREGAICTVPFCYRNQWLGAVCLQWSWPESPSQDHIRQVEELFSIAGPLLGLVAAEERSLWRKALASSRELAGALIGRAHIGKKLLGLGLLVALLLLHFYQVNYRIAGDALLEGRIQQVMVAPVDGFIATAPVRAGDIVEAGSLLCTLDDRELKLERSRAMTERLQFAREHREALAQRERVEARILEARVEQVEARIALIDSRLERTRITAPFAAIVTEGDLSQSIGAPVSRGEPLLTLAPLDSYRIIIKVDESDIADIAPGQHGQLVLTSRHGEALPLLIEHITTVSTPAEGRNYFRVEAKLLDSSQGLLPGMQGVAKISIEPRSLLWIWTHRMADWLSLCWWYLRP